MSDPTFDFALTLRCYRKRLGLDQAELAELLNVTQATISRWEAGIRAPRDPVEVLMHLHELSDVFDDIVDDVIALAMSDAAGRVILTTYQINEHWWLADERARDLALPASMHQAATAQAAREISADDGTVVTIRASR
ncbi:helix-turn-helix transcriptional regulator [Actinomyces massiliensis]|jgi:DNA-binding helix-turn-helix protein|uniref:DNA-binding helix-turn-helix protein n=1 Tax=Actinomyces massiliensis F0489 TaxID=1125718 RepID=J1HPV4_9ACTO|nr:helix-turn-helix transcriptional regulator [Actinomyces massiliensis]EJF47613.1 DNA-binding helix-turn-helix protein [Actinomyces massiliensis F0489]WLD70453.1 helix-turn-helix transcriptional regulator [Actinomyces massiliensis]